MGNSYFGVSIPEGATMKEEVQLAEIVDSDYSVSR
jgi:hypothetical protein